MERNELLNMLKKAVDLFREDEQLIDETGKTINSMIQAQNGIADLYGKNYPALSQNEYYANHPYELEPEPMPEHSQVFDIIGTIIAFVGLIYAVFRLIGSPIMFFRAKSVLKKSGSDWLAKEYLNFLEKLLYKRMQWFAHTNFLSMFLSTIIAVVLIVAVTAALWALFSYFIQDKVNERNRQSDLVKKAAIEEEKRKCAEEELYQAYLRARDARNREIDNQLENNKKQIQKYMQDIQKYKDICEKNAVRHQAIWDELEKDVLPYYPPDYTYAEAAEAFYSAVRNMAASTMKEAVNRYLDDRQYEKTRAVLEKQIVENKKNAEIQIKAMQSSSDQLQVMLAGVQSEIQKGLTGVQSAVHANTNAVNRQTGVIQMQTKVLSDRMMQMQVQQMFTAIGQANRDYAMMNRMDKINNGIETHNLFAHGVRRY